MNILQLYRKLRNEYYLRKRKKYFPELREIFQSNTSVISSNCFAGRIMQDLHYKYNSPTLGLYFFAEDYIKFLKNLKHNLLSAKLTFTDVSKYPVGNERRKNWPYQYPIGLLDEDIEIHFLHYHSEDEAKEKWYKRAKRVNFDDLVVIGMQQNLSSRKVVEEFCKLPFKRKAYFVTEDIPDLKEAVFIPEFKGMEEVGDPYKKGHIFYKYMINKLCK